MAIAEGYIQGNHIFTPQCWVKLPPVINGSIDINTIDKKVIEENNITPGFLSPWTNRIVVNK